MPLNIDEVDAAHRQEIDRRELLIEAAVKHLLTGIARQDSGMIRSLAEASQTWWIKTSGGVETGLYTARDNIRRKWSESHGPEAQRARANLSQLAESIQAKFVNDIVARLKSNGLSLDHLNSVLSAIDDELQAHEQLAEHWYSEWVTEHGGNKPTPRAYLRLALDDCLQGHIKARYRRARIIACTQVAVSVIEEAEIEQESKRVNSFLRERGR